MMFVHSGFHNARPCRSFLRLRDAWILLLTLSLPGPAAWALVRYVTPTGEAGGLIPCYSLIQDAVTSATAGDEIRIAAGVYDQLNTASGVPQVVWITKSLALRGGYSPDFSQWDPASFPTTIDARGEGRGLLVVGDPLKQGGSNYPRWGAAIDVSLAGLRVIRGNGQAILPGSSAPGAALPSRLGGGLVAQWANVTLADCAFTSNTACGAAEPRPGGHRRRDLR